MRLNKHGLLAGAPLTVSMALILGACGGGSGGVTSTAQQAPGPVPVPVQHATAPVPAVGTSPAKEAPPGAAKDARLTPAQTKGKSAASIDLAAGQAKAPVAQDPKAAKPGADLAKQRNGATDQGVTKDSIKLGSVAMYGMPLGNMFITPAGAGLHGTLAAINDRGGVLGRRLELIDCDDGPGEVSRSKACIKKLVVQDRIFALLGYASWATASVHSDLAQHGLPAVATWAYSQTEWQDAFMFPTHMSMIHEAMAGANWVKNVIRPKTYGLICLTSPEMQLACDQVQKVLDPTGAKMVKHLNVAISETSMSAQVLAMRGANPEHIVHYVINPATIAKFVVESAQQGYFPPKGMSGNHMAAEVLGTVFGKWPAGRYWTNTTYKLWGPEFIATMNRYAPSTTGATHHIIQALYFGALMFERGAKAVGPNLTRQRLMAQLSNGDVYQSDAALDQRFSYSKPERGGNLENQTWSQGGGQGREFMYKYVSPNTRANPDGSPSGFEPDSGQFEIYTWK